ncbi:hypothetical protein D9V32_06875 [Mycetocola tolaasinivorans]|uniref:DUF5302 domain-containing protein n=1 Tax=Mycetocola tolaasinivorans TaxID=76635 RepID=A0A3L7A8A0_9MICO|nr:DUF5302 domain-containing protein [Mycetocola tolaasinivorans]RLP76563.1 hypothetical protein D9V32_06875 [Mycetocola tolaasinivorans]
MSSTDDAATASAEETKRKFREALERKKQRAQGGEDHLDSTGSVRQAQGKAPSQRQFRRKSGG